MANPDQKTILIESTCEEIKQICITLKKEFGVTNLDLEILLKGIIKDLNRD